jgi:hypothetical protein
MKCYTTLNSQYIPLAEAKWVEKPGLVDQCFGLSDETVEKARGLANGIMRLHSYQMVPPNEGESSSKAQALPPFGYYRIFQSQVETHTVEDQRNGEDLADAATAVLGDRRLDVKVKVKSTYPLYLLFADRLPDLDGFNVVALFREEKISAFLISPPVGKDLDQKPNRRIQTA